MRLVAHLGVVATWLAGIACGTYLIVHDFVFSGLSIAFLALCCSAKSSDDPERKQGGKP